VFDHRHRRDGEEREQDHGRDEEIGGPLPTEVGAELAGRPALGSVAEIPQGTGAGEDDRGGVDDRQRRGPERDRGERPDHADADGGRGGNDRRGDGHTDQREREVRRHAERRRGPGTRPRRQREDAG